MRDIETRKDIELLVDRFYDRMLGDIIIGFIFTDIAKIDPEEHKPVICDFWETVLFNRAVYKRGPEVMNVHKRLNEKVPLKKGHFRRWLFYSLQPWTSCLRATARVAKEEKRIPERA